MPKRKEDENKKRKLWCETQMAKAIEAVREMKKASKEFQVPRASLFRLINKGELQIYLVEWSPCSTEKKECLQSAYQLAVRNNISHPFKDKTADNDWFYGFMKRNPNLSIRKPLATSFARTRGFNKEVDKFFDLVDVVFKKHNYYPNRIFNVDETGLSVAQIKVHRVVGLKGKRQTGSLTSAERGFLVTIISYMVLEVTLSCLL
ncbi:uncharacterized protein LOC108743582 [Nephila pilipes]|uniref:Uncharacterized protein LOC108743582 n=1 Tax=Nephila pilipes TaxID=299642 RepID=A0A8X6R1S7_NEPPI|nr:uncharacterized protein LOC108743582 [Nephila pilipes]